MQSGFMKWCRENYCWNDFKNLSALYSDELELAREIFNCKPAWDAAKSFLGQLEPLSTYDADEADKLIDKANIMYRESRNLEQAAVVYTRAIYKAPFNSSQLAHAHANRAAVLYKLQYYEAAYEDCARALDFNHPAVESILTRQAVIAWRLKDQEKLQKSIQCFENLNIMVPSQIRKFHEQLVSSDFTTHATAEEPVFKVPKFNKIKVSKNAERGRFYVAVDTIEANELILEDIAATLMPTHADSFNDKCSSTDEYNLVFMCDNCAEADIVPFPCYECRSVFYCSKKCAQENLPIHRFECRGYKTSLFNSIFRGRLGFRCFLLSFDAILHDLQTIKESGIVNTAEELWPMILKTGKEGKILGLHNNFHRIQKIYNFVPYGLCVFLLTLYLSEQTDFFEQTRAVRLALMPSETEWLAIVTGLILHFMSISSINGLSCIVCHFKKPFTERNIALGSLFGTFALDSTINAIYCWFSFFNHSCHSNAVFFNSASKVQVYSRRRISKGEEVTIDYLSNSGSLNRNQRKLMMRKYCDCHCERCLDEQDPIYVQSMGISCECGGYCMLNEESSACKKCGKHSILKFFFNSAFKHKQLENCLDAFFYLYGACAILKKSIEDKSVEIFSKAGENILKKFLASTNEEVLGDEQINRLMVKLAVDLLEITQKAYFPPLNRAVYALMLIDLISIRKARGFQEPKFIYKDLIEDAIWVIGGKPKETIDVIYKLNCL